MKDWRPKDIRELRLKLNLTQQAFAEEVGVSREYINYLEKGVRNAGKTLKILLSRIESEIEKGERRKNGKGHFQET